MSMTSGQIHDLALLYAEKTTGTLDHNTRNHPNALDVLYQRYLFALREIAARNEED